MNRITEFILKWNIPIAIIMIVVTIFLGYQIKDLRIENSVEGMVLENDPDKIFFEEFQKEFGSDQIIIIGLETGNVFDTSVLSTVDDITRSLEEIKQIDEVISLTNVKEITGSEGLIEVGRLVKKLPETTEEVESLRTKIYSNPLYLNYLIDDRERVTAIYAILPEDEIDQSVTDPLVEDVRKILSEKVPENIKYYVAGVPVVKRDMGSFLKKDQKVFTPLTFVLMAVILFAVFKNIKITIIPLFMVFFSISWSLGFVTLMDRPMTVVLSMLTPLVIVMTVAHNIHIFAHYNENNNIISDKDASVRTTITHMLLPCLMTTVTTAFGFSSLSISHIAPVRDFGIFTALGVVFAFIIVLTLVPIIINRLNINSGDREKNSFFIIDKILKRLSYFVRIHKTHVVIVSLLLVVISIVGMFKIKVETDLIGYFKEKSDIYKSTFFIQENLTGTTTLNVVIEGESDGTLYEPRVLGEMEDLQEYLESKPEVRKTISICDFIKDMNKAMHDGDPEFYKLPDSRNLVAQYLLLYSFSGDPDDFDRFVDFNYQKGTVSARLTHMNSKELTEFISDLKEYCALNFSPDLEVRVTGTTVLYANLTESLVRGQIESIILAMITIFIIMSIVFRSIYLGFLSMIPNVIPILLTLGLMGWMGINLDSSTTMIASVAIGIAVDDTIHFMVRYFREVGDGNNPETAIRNTMKHTGRPIIVTTIIIGSGFITLVFASFIPTIYFGLLTAFTMFSALVGDLLVLPVILLIFRPRFRGWGSFPLDKY